MYLPTSKSETSLAIKNSSQGWKTIRLQPLILGLLISVAAMTITFRHVNFQQFTDQLLHAQISALFTMTMVYGIIMIVRTWRWQLLLGKDISLQQAGIIVGISYLLNTLLPFRVGELARIDLTRRFTPYQMSNGIASLMVERMLDLFLAMGFTLIGLIFLPNFSEQNIVAYVLKPLLLVTTLAVIFAIFSSRYGIKVIRSLGTYITNRFQYPPIRSIWRQLEQLTEKLIHIRNNKQFHHIILLSIFLWLLYLLYYQIGFWAFNVNEGSFKIAFLVVGFVALGISTPSLPGAIGIFHAAVVLALYLNGQDTTLATTYAWGVWIPQTIVILFSGLLSIGFARKSFNLSISSTITRHSQELNLK